MGWVQAAGYGRWDINLNAQETEVTVISLGNSSPVVIAPERSNRKFVTLYNVSGVLYVKLGQGVSTNSYSFIVTSKSHVCVDRYGGVITAIKGPGDGISQVAVTDAF